MEIVNKIKDGMHQDNNVFDQPDMTMRDNLNGVITDIGNGNFKWSNIKGNSLSFTLPGNNKYFAHCLIRDRLIIITLDEVGSVVKIYELFFYAPYLAVPVELYSTNNTEFNFSFAYPITAIWGFYENNDIQRIYLTDNNNPPRCLDIGSGAIVMNEKFTQFTPVIDNVYGKFYYTSQSIGGNIKAGVYFFAWRYYLDSGYYTDWSPLTNPIQVTDDVSGSTGMAYQDMQGAAPDENTGKKINFTIGDADDDYEHLQVCAFYSNDYNISEPGVLIFDQDITPGTTDYSFSFNGNENLGSVTIDELIEVSLVIEKCKDMIYAKKKNVIANITERTELNLPSKVDVSLSTATYTLPLDCFAYPEKMINPAEDKVLFAIHTSSYDQTNHKLRVGGWYMANTDVVYRNTWGGADINVDSGDIFQVSLAATYPNWISGTYTQVIVKKKYKKNTVPTGNINDDYALYTVPIPTGEYPDFKGVMTSHHLKSYPQGEKVRLGILFFDKTGRPFFIRHLNNTNASYDPGDIRIPYRDADKNPIISEYMHAAGGINGFGVQINANLTYIKISGLDITDIKDQIGGFMIVRAPIIRQYIGMGVLAFVHHVVADNYLYVYPNFSSIGLDTLSYPGCYAFYCPEDVFNFKDFVLQEGDELENMYYLRPYYESESFTFLNPVSGMFMETYSGIGRRESNQFDFYHKFGQAINSYSTPNGIPANPGAFDKFVPGAVHEIKTVTKFTFNDDMLTVDPLEPTKKYRMRSYDYSAGLLNHYGWNNSHSVVMLDIDETAIAGLPNKKGYAGSTYARALLCSVKRENAEPYGGVSDASLANSLYMTLGHFQEITPAVLADIENAGTWIFNEIDIFGGDTFVNLWDYKRYYGNEDVEHNKNLGQSMIIPIESRMNLAMREGDHIAQVRSYDSANNTLGIRMKVGNERLESFSYNDGYSSDDISDYYYPLPFNFNSTDLFDGRIRYSPEKNYGELIDNFRIFHANDKIDLDLNRGAIFNIKYSHDRVIYWQPDEVGYIPIYERALTQNAIGQPVQLGVGGLFDRYDQLISMIGNSHHFGIVESPIGFHWYDAKRKIFLTIDHSMKISNDSILKGLDSYFQNNLPNDFDLYDRPFYFDGGCFGVYDPMSKMVFYSFIFLKGDQTTIMIHTSINKFIGFSNAIQGNSFTYKSFMIAMNSDLLKGYVQGIGDYNNFFGTQYPAYLKLVVKEQNNETKIFDKIEYIGNSNLFTKIKYENSLQSIEETLSSYATGSCVLLSRYYDYKKKRWFGTIPKVSRERLNDGYLLITFTMEDKYLVELYELKTTVRKIY